MKAVVVFESMFGNSEQVARAIGRGIEQYAEVVVGDVAHVPPDEAAADLLVVGGPTHAFSMTRPITREDAIRQGARQGLADRGLREWLQELPSELHGRPAAAFDTRVTRVRRLPGSAARSAARALRRRHARLVVAPESFFVEDVAGPLAPEELERAEQWGRSLVARVGDDCRADAG